VADTVAGLVKAAVQDWRVRPILVEGEAQKADAMRAGTVALACSGTVTTELAGAGVPMVVTYKVGETTYQILRHLVTTRYASLVNIAAGSAVAPELLQHEATGEKLAAAVGPLLDDPERRARQIAAQNAALEKMGRGLGDPTAKAAEAVIVFLKEKGRL
jgi:lipid-A-disaccharide synthase